MGIVDRVGELLPVLDHGVVVDLAGFLLGRFVVDHASPLGGGGFELRQWQPQSLGEHARDVLFHHDERDAVGVADVVQRDDGRFGNGRHDGQLLAGPVLDRGFTPYAQEIRSQSQLHHGLDRVLGWFGLLFPVDFRNQRDVEKAHVFVSDIFLELPQGLDKGHRLNVPEGPAQLDDADFRRQVLVCTRVFGFGFVFVFLDDVRHGLPRDVQDPLLDRVADVRHHLDGLSEVLADSLPLDDLLVDLSRRQIGRPGERNTQKALVIAQIQIALSAVVQDIDLSVLSRAHGTGVDVEVGIDFECRDAESHPAKEHAQRRSGDALSDSGHDTARDDHQFPVCFICLVDQLLQRRS
mmetsp:Transcript_8239/g.24329  ORF Transcript_8239/g.24329 Transcript_8239/m.24329 type:complete len:351 (+) Transcript_8239:1761-2813(+)